MQPGYICVAGIDGANEHVRPVQIGRLSAQLLARNGGPFAIGNVVELGQTVTVGEAPEVEDQRFNVSNLRLVGTVKPAQFWKTLSDVAEDSLKGIFGDELEQHGNGCAVDPGSGSASLGCLRPTGDCVIQVDRFDKVRLRCSDEEFEVNLSVTDLRLFQNDQKTPRRKVIERVGKKLIDGEELLICVGLARRWQKPGDTMERHWLQVNNLHFADDPLGEDFA